MIISLLVDIWQSFKYGVLKQRPNIDFSEIPNEFKFISHYDELNDVHWLEVQDMPEFIVSGKTTKELANNFTDTLLVYYDIPTYFAKRFAANSNIVFEITNQKTKKQEIINLNYKEALSKALA